MYIPFFKYGCTLEINTQRTAAYVANIPQIAIGGQIRSDIRLSCDCPQLQFGPDDTGTIVGMTYDTPANDNVSWYDPDIPESARFLGFMVEDFTQNSVVSRQMSTRISSSGGGALGPIRNKERRMDFSVLLFACDEAAMEYGFRYLTDALGSTGCDEPCVLCDSEFRDSCSEITDLEASFDQGRWILKNVGMIDGPVWGDNPIQSGSCNVRRVKFSLGSEMPWKYKCPVVQCQDVALAGFPSEGTDCDNWDQILCGHQEVSCSVSESKIVGETALIIEITAGSVPLQHIKLAIRPDRFGYECDADSRPAGYTRVDPCDLIYIPELPSGYVLTYDTSVETITVTAPGGGVYDGLYLVATEEGKAPTFPTLKCGTFCVSVSVSECSVIGDPKVTISSVHREI